MIDADATALTVPGGAESCGTTRMQLVVSPLPARPTQPSYFIQILGGPPMSVTVIRRCNPDLQHFGGRGRYRTADRWCVKPELYH